jgi:hypothetical protein
LISRRIVVKDLRCHDLMNWFEQRFGFQIIYLVRHPVPTSLSRKSYARLPLFLGNDDYCERFLTPRLRSYANSILENGSDLEKKVLDWCLQNLPPLKFLDRSNWICLHYEDLVLDPTVPIDRLASTLGLAHKDRMLRQARVASRSAFQSDAETRSFLTKGSSGPDRLYLINRWRSRISSDQEKRLRELLVRFDIGLYDPAAELPITRL